LKVQIFHEVSQSHEIMNMTCLKHWCWWGDTHWTRLPPLWCVCQVTFSAFYSADCFKAAL